MNNTSFWADTTPKTDSYASLSGNIETDIAIIGGGITGLTAALQLSGEGKKVTLIEAYHIGDGTTGFSTGNLYVPVQSYFQNIRSKFDKYITKIVAASRLRSIDFIESTIHEKNIDCSFQRRPWYMYATTAEKSSMIDAEAEVLREVGLLQVEDVKEVPFPTLVRRAIKVDNQARFNPLKYVRELARSLSSEGVEIFENTIAENIEEQNDRCIILTDRGRIIARYVIMATHIPKGINMVQTMTAPYRSYVIGVRLKSRSYFNANIWDTSSPHHTISTHSNSQEPDILLIAGNHHKTGQGEHNDHIHYYRELEEFARKYFDIESIDYHWSAQHYHSGDGIPYVGPASRASDRVFMATGFYADGLVYGTMAGINIADMILNDINPWITTYNSTRFTPIQSAGEFIKENVNVFTQYLKVLPGTADAKAVADIRPGEGKVIEHWSEKTAVYRDDQNQIHALSAVCPHMKCIVRFNNAETTWDCPCHGSRFTIHGKVIEGPAYTDLKEKNI